MNIPLELNAPLVLRSPADLLVELPAVLGFVPTDSLVVLLVRGNDLRCTLRFDLLPDLTEAAIRAIAVAHRADADGALLAVYTENPGDPEHPFAAQVERVIGLLEEQGIDVRDALLVDDDRWWSYCCEDPGCCPPEGSPVPRRVAVLEADRAVRGRRPVAASRADAVSAFQLQPPLPRETLRAAEEALGHYQGLDTAKFAFAALETLARALTTASQDASDALDDELRAIVALAVQDVHLRDYLLGRAIGTWTDLVAPCDALVTVALRSPDRLRSATAAAAMALLAADGTGSVGIWALAEHAAGSSLADLVVAGVDAGLPPEDLREVLTAALPDVENLLRDRGQAGA